MEKFGSRIGISNPSVSTIESGKSNPSNQTILAICREFGVSEMWLRTGEGKPYPERGRLEELSYMAGRFLSNEPTEFQRRFATMMFSLTDEEWKLLEQKARALLEELPEP
jgi:transcriptional regulator with XRE-family HTH domain